LLLTTRRVVRSCAALLFLLPTPSQAKTMAMADAGDEAEDEPAAAAPASSSSSSGGMKPKVFPPSSGTIIPALYFRVLAVLPVSFFTSSRCDGCAYGASLVERHNHQGRGHKGPADASDRFEGRGGVFDSVAGSGGGAGPAKSVEGWILFVTGVHKEAQEDDILDKFSDFGDVRNINGKL